MRYYVCLILILFAVISCSKNVSSDSYNTFISELEEIGIEERIKIEFDDSPVYRPLNIATNGKHAIMVDAANWTLHLMDKKGNFLDSTGGKGRGPNEYSLINQIHFGADNQLYVLDKRSKAVSVYTIGNNVFQFEGEMALPAYTGFYIQAIYQTKNGFIGIFKKVKVPTSEDEKFYIHKLNDDLELQESLIEMPGNETYTSSQGIQRDKPLGAKTYWGMTGDQFYYTVTNNLSVTSVNIQNGSSTIYDFSDVPKPIKNQKALEFIETRAQPMFQAEPELKEIIREGEYMPYFIDFLPTENYFYYTLFFQGTDNGMLLRINKETNEFKKITVPAVFNVYGAHGDMLFGIDHTTDGANEIVFLQLES